jgi:hypothetical protein
VAATFREASGFGPGHLGVLVAEATEDAAASKHIIVRADISS